MQNIGLHFTIAKGFSYAAKTVSELGGNTFQFFSRNPRGSRIKIYDENDLACFQEFRKTHQFGPIMAHAPYTINLASLDKNICTFSREVVETDIRRMSAIGAEYFNLHPGNHMGNGAEEGIAQIIRGLNQCLDGDVRITVLLETMSGKGSEVGYRFEQLCQIMDGLKYGEKVGVCMDLCHMFSSGYDIVHELDDVLCSFDKIIGLEKLKAIHLNDSKHELGSKKDSHAPIGEGYIGLDSVVRIMNHPCIKDLPFFLETPLDDEGHKREISMLKKALSRNVK
ncbi:MAG: deoxyribonuclease IV [Oscillospiraceae bacterium]